MTRCTCTVFARNIKLHAFDCAMRQAYEQREQQSPPSAAERKAGKSGRIKALVRELRPNDIHVDEQLMKLLGIKKKRWVKQ